MHGVHLHLLTVSHAMFSTAKYNLLSFFPKFLYEQFSLYANLFFLLVSIIQVGPSLLPSRSIMSRTLVTAGLSFVAVHWHAANS